MSDEGTKPTTPAAPVAGASDGLPRPDITALGRLLHGPRDISTVSLVGIFLLGFVAFLYFAKPFLMPVILAVLLNFLLKPIARWLCRRGLPLRRYRWRGGIRPKYRDMDFRAFDGDPAPQSHSDSARKRQSPCRGW